MKPIEAHKKLDTLLCLIQDEACQAAYRAFHANYEPEFLEMPASIKQHHNWPGGYAVHICEVVTNTANMMKFMNIGADFSVDQAIVAAYIHDIDKLLYRYQRTNEPPTDAQIKFARSLGIDTDGVNKNSISILIDAAKNKTPIDPLKLPQHEYRPTALALDDCALVAWLCCMHELPIPMLDKTNKQESPIVYHAVSWHHGGWAPIARAGRDGYTQVNPLAALLHSADYMSASAQMGREDLQRML